MGPAALNCTGGSGFLTLTNASGVLTAIHAVVIAPGTRFPTQPSGLCTTIADCLELPNTSLFPAFTQVNGAPAIYNRIVIVAP